MTVQPKKPLRFDSFSNSEYAQHVAIWCAGTASLARRGRYLPPDVLNSVPDWRVTYSAMDPERREKRLRDARDEMQLRLALAHDRDDLVPILTALVQVLSALLAGTPLPDAAMDACRTMALGQQATENTRQPQAQPIQTPPKLGLGTDRQRHARKRAPHLRVVGDPRRGREEERGR